MDVGRTANSSPLLSRCWLEFFHLSRSLRASSLLHMTNHCSNSDRREGGEGKAQPPVFACRISVISTTAKVAYLCAQPFWRPKIQGGYWQVLQLAMCQHPPPTSARQRAIQPAAPPCHKQHSAIQSTDNPKPRLRWTNPQPLYKARQPSLHKLMTQGPRP